MFHFLNRRQFAKLGRALFKRQPSASSSIRARLVHEAGAYVRRRLPPFANSPHGRWRWSKHDHAVSSSSRPISNNGIMWFGFSTVLNPCLVCARLACGANVQSCLFSSTKHFSVGLVFAKQIFFLSWVWLVIKLFIILIVNVFFLLLRCRFWRRFLVVYRLI